MENGGSATAFASRQQSPDEHQLSMLTLVGDGLCMLFLAGFSSCFKHARNISHAAVGQVSSPGRATMSFSVFLLLYSSLQL